MKSPRKGAAPLTRRRFVAMLAAGSAALIAPSGASAAAAAVGRRRAPAATPAGIAPADRKELLRQLASTTTTLEVIRRHAMPPGTELASIFKPVRSRRGSR